MRFAERLRTIGNEFREKYLDSNDEKDNTILDDNWKNMRVSLHFVTIIS